MTLEPTAKPRAAPTLAPVACVDNDMGLDAAGGEQDCHTAKDLDLCGDESAEGALTKKYCPKTCGTCTEALTASPTVAPTVGLTVTPTATPTLAPVACVDNDMGLDA